MGGRRWPTTPPSDDTQPEAQPEEVARTILLRRLEASPRTRSELAATLRDRNIPDDAAGLVLDRFEEVGLVDDQAFAAMWVESRQRTRNLSRRALRNELQLKGVAAELISEALASIEADQELAAARRVAARKARSVMGLPRETQYRRISGALARKGYSAGLCMQVVRELFDAGAEDSEAADGSPH